MEKHRTLNVRDAAILTTSYVAGTTLERTQGENQLVLYVDFTIGSLTTGELKVEFSSDNTNWYQETSSSVSGGTSSESVMEHSFGATGAFRLAIPLKDMYVRVSIKGTGTVTASEASIIAVLGWV